MATKTKPAKKPAKRAAKSAKRPATKRSAKKTAKRSATPRPKKSDALPVTRATGRPRGRPPKIDQPSLCDPSKTVGVAIVDLVADGLPPDVAAPLAGAHPKTIDVWLGRGAAEITRLVAHENPDEPMTESEEPFVAFSEELLLADASSRGTALLTLKRLGERNHPALLAYLGVRWPSLYSQRATRLEVSGPNGGPVRTAIEIPSIDEAERRVAEVEAANRDRLSGAINVESRAS